MQPEICAGDVTAQDVEVIVNAWNRNIIPWWLLIPTGVSGAIKRKAGIRPFIELGRVGAIPLGGAVKTSAGRLPYRAIIHVAGINLAWRASEESIRASVRSAMRIVDEENFSSVAFPVIGAGAGSFGADGALGKMLEEFETIDSRATVRVVRFDRARARKLP